MKHQKSTPFRTGHQRSFFALRVNTFLLSRLSSRIILHISCLSHTQAHMFYSMLSFLDTRAQTHTNTHFFPTAFHATNGRMNERACVAVANRIKHIVFLGRKDIRFILCRVNERQKRMLRGRKKKVYSGQCGNDIKISGKKETNFS